MNQIDWRPNRYFNREIDATTIVNENTTINYNAENDQSIEALKEIQEYIKEKKEVYNNLIRFLESNDNNEENFQNFIGIISQQKEEENEDKLKKILQLIINIANNHHREEWIFKKIFQLIEYYENQIKQTFSNIDIFHIFESNKKILLFLFKKGIIIIDDTIYNELLSKSSPNDNRYCHFFYPEIKNFIGEEKAKSIEKELLEKDSNIFEYFEEKREEGENETYICSLIRKDSVEDFIKYINCKNICTNSTIKPSIFETNSFLLEQKSIALIEYAAFFGSIEIFQYLIFNDAELKPSLWLYAIHSRNAEIIHLLEQHNVYPPNNQYEKCFYESIKCHHNEIAEYIENNFLSVNNDKIRKSDQFISTIMKFHNYSYFPFDFKGRNEFFYLCSNSFDKLVNLFIKMKEEVIKKEISERIKIYIFINL